MTLTESSPFSLRVAPAGTMPAWATGITQTHKLVEVGARWDDPVLGLNVKYQWPGNDPTFGGGLYAGLDGTFSDFHDAYGSALYLENAGLFGQMLYAGTGENVIMEQMSTWDLNKDLPDWQMFQQPGYIYLVRDPGTWGSRPSTAQVPLGSWYYAPNEYAALPAARKIPWNAGTASTGEDAWGSAWDKAFPVGRAGFMIWEKTGASELGNNRPIMFRYGMPAYVPASIAGNSQGSILVVNNEFGGSFAGVAGPPANVAAADWYANVWPSGRPCRFVYAMDVATRQWTVVGPMPDINETYGLPGKRMSWVDPVARRVYWYIYSSGPRFFYADLANGISAATVVGPVTMTITGGDDGVGTTIANAVTCAIESGPLAGKVLGYMFDNGSPRRLVCVDFQAQQLYAMSPANMPSGFVIFAWDPATNRVFMVERGSSYVRVSEFAIPTSFSNAGSYSLSSAVTMDASGITFDGTLRATNHYGDRCHYLSRLGGIMLLTQGQGKMLAFKPT